MLDQKLAEAMQRILAKPDEKRFLLNEARRRLVEDFSLGTKRGASVYFSERDRVEMRTLLEARGYATTLVDMVGMTRGECLDVTPNEKAGGEAVKRNRISIKALAGQPLLIGDSALHLPAETHLDADWTKIVGQMKHRCIMVVENYENFNRLHQVAFDLPPGHDAPLVVYHGDPNESRLDNVQQFIDAAALPVLAFMDIDPAGIYMATRFRHLVAIVAPCLETLETQLASPKTGRRDLFQAQFSNYGETLRGLPINSPAFALWQLVNRHRSGIVQERWIASGERCKAWIGMNWCRRPIDLGDNQITFEEAEDRFLVLFDFIDELAIYLRLKEICKKYGATEANFIEVLDAYCFSIPIENMERCYLDLTAIGVVQS